MEIAVRLNLLCLFTFFQIEVNATVYVQDFQKRQLFNPAVITLSNPRWIWWLSARSHTAFTILLMYNVGSNVFVPVCPPLPNCANASTYLFHTTLRAHACEYLSTEAHFKWQSGPEIRLEDNLKQPIATKILVLFQQISGGGSSATSPSMAEDDIE